MSVFFGLWGASRPPKQFFQTLLCLGNLGSRSWGNRCPHSGGTAGPTEANRYLFLTVRTPRQAWFGNNLGIFSQTKEPGNFLFVLFVLSVLLILVFVLFVLVVLFVLFVRFVLFVLFYPVSLVFPASSNAYGNNFHDTVFEEGEWGWGEPE